MVLEEVSSNTDAFGSEPIPTNDSDPFASQAPSDVQITLDLSTLPKPVPIVGWIVGYGTQARANRLHQSLQQAQSVLQRPLRQDEAHAIAHTYSQIMATASWGDTLGIAFGAYQCYRTSSYFRFPFWTPNPEKFTPDSLGPFRGAQARALWHSMRALPYLAMGAFVGDLFFRNYATVNAAMSMRKDERLAEFNTALEGVMQKKLEDVSQRRQRNRQFPEAQQREREGLAAGAGGGTAAAASSSSSAPKRAGRANDGIENDDASPTGGAFADSYGDRAGAGMLSDSQVRASEAQRRSDDAAYDHRYEATQRQQRQQDSQYARQSSNNGNGNSPRTQQPSRQDDRRDSFDLGESDPLSASQQQQGGAALPSWARNRNAASGSGSSWDRLRQQAQGGSGAAGISSQQQQQQQQQQQKGSTAGDGFAFSSADEERQLARSEAQRDFDRRLERERQGRDFDEGGKRW